MKRVFLATLLCLVFNLAAVTVTANTSANLLLNPSFDGNIDEWVNYKGISFVYDSSVYYDGIGGSGKVISVIDGLNYVAWVFQPSMY